MNILHLKLSTGEDIFGQEVTIKDGLVILHEVLVMETIQSEESKYMFMTRYTPFQENKTIAIPAIQIMFYGAVTDVVKNHYINSLEFCHKMSDENFNEGIQSATGYLKRVLASEQNTDEVIEDDELLIAKASPTKH